VQFVYGDASGTVLSSGGAQAVFGSASGETIASGAYACAESGGTMSGAMVDGTLGVVGSAVSATIGSHANATIHGQASGTTINSGGFEYVASGGVEGGATISGGALELASGGSAGMVTFADNGAAGGIFQIDDSMHFSGLVAGFSSTIPDLGLLDIPYLADTTTYSWSQTTTGNNGSGTLTVSEGGGGATANITLLGNYAAGQFALSAYGPGTLVNDPPVAGSSAMLATAQA
jgi:autotransporter passenger strand-loop-strand repeat protein